MTAAPALAALAAAIATLGILQRWRPPPPRFAALADRRRWQDDPRPPVRPGATAAAVLAVVLAGWVVHPVLGLVGVGVGTFAGPLRQRAASRRDEAELRDALPDLIDLFRSGVDAGLTIGQSLDAIAVRVDGTLRTALHEVRRRIALGARRVDALEVLYGLGDPVRPLVTALIASERDGAPLGTALEAIAADARLSRRRAAEESARRLPVQLLFPLVLCILPAFGLLTVVPLLAGTLRSLTV